MAENKEEWNFDGAQKYLFKKYIKKEINEYPEYPEYEEFSDFDISISVNLQALARTKCYSWYRRSNP